jgi:hypothetical protein
VSRALGGSQCSLGGKKALPNDDIDKAVVICGKIRSVVLHLRISTLKGWAAFFLLCFALLSASGLIPLFLLAR